MPAASSSTTRTTPSAGVMITTLRGHSVIMHLTKAAQVVEWPFRETGRAERGEGSVILEPHHYGLLDEHDCLGEASSDRLSVVLDRVFYPYLPIGYSKG